MNPLLSVVVPFHNVERYLEECLASVQAQTLTDFECLVVDDGSPDDGHLIAERFAAGDPRFRLIRTSNLGVGPARNLGASLATGTYLTFADADDIVPPRAYSLMTAVLAQTGSSLAAGNARRFDGPQGVTQSWTHAGPFAKTRLATHITAHPDLIRDRMVWNKVYRRDFWEGSGLSFPAIRYEDYPVAVRAHLEASAVDVISDHVYYWRQRGTGDSITQSLFQLDNMLDRVRSAEATLAIAEDLGTPTVVRRLHEYFIDVDLVVMARALVSGDPDDLPEIERMGRSLAGRLQPMRRSANPLGDVIHEAFLRGDIAMAKGMARWRDGEGVSGIRAEIPLLPRPSQLRPLIRRARPRPRLPDPRKPRRLRSALQALTLREGVSTLTTTVRVRPQVAHRADVAVVLTTGGIELELPTETEPTPTGLRLTSRVGVEDVERFGVLWEEAQVVVRLNYARLAWQGTVDAAPTLLPGPVLCGHSAHQWAAPRGHALRVRRTDRIHVASAEVVGEHFVLRHPWLHDPSIYVDRPFPTERARFSTSGLESRIEATVLLDDPADEPVAGVVERAVSVERVLSNVGLLLLGEPAVIERGGRRAELDRNSHGSLVVRLSPVSVLVEQTAAVVAEVEDHDVAGGAPPAELGELPVGTPEPGASPAAP